MPIKNPIDCITKYKGGALATPFNKLVESGMTPHEAARELILQEQEALHNDLNDIRVKLGAKKVPFTKPPLPDTKNISDEYETKIKEATTVPIQAETKSAEPPKPPEIIPPTEEGTGDEEGRQLSGIRKALVSEQMVKDVNLEKISDKEMMSLGRRILDTGEVNPRALVEKIITDRAGVLTPAQVVAMITYKADIDNKVRELYAESNRRRLQGEDQGTLPIEIKNLEREIDDFDVAAVITAAQQSSAFRLRQYMLDNNYNVTTEIEKYKNSNDGYIEPEMEAKFKEMGKKREAAKERIAEIKKEKENQEGQEAVDNIKEKVDRENQRKSETEKKTFKERAKKAADTFRKLKTKPFKFKDKDGNEYDVTKMGVSWNDLVELGAKAIEKTGQIADGIKAVFDKIQNAEWYKKLSKEDKTRLFSELEDFYKNAADESPEGRRIKQLEKQLEDLQQGIVRSRNEPIDSPRIQELKEQIFEAKKNLGLTPSKMGVPKQNYGLKVTPEQKRLERLEKELDDLRQGIIKERVSKLEDTSESKRLKEEIYEAKKNLGLIKGRPLPEEPTIKLNDDGSLYIPPKMIESLVEKGVTDIDGLVDNIYDDAVKLKPDVTKRELRDYITDYGRQVNPKADEVQRQLNTAKRIGKLLSEVEDLQNKKEKEKNESTKAKITEKERELKRQIRALQKDAGIDTRRTPTDEEKLSAAKQRVKDRITELERRLKNKDFAKPKKLSTPKDEELVKLETEKQRLESEFDTEQFKVKLKQRNWWQKTEDVAIELFSGLIRGLVASFDLSAGFVQGMYRMFTDIGKSGIQFFTPGKKVTPNRTINAFGTMFKHLVSQKASDDYLAKIKASPAYPIMQASKLAIDDKSGHVSAKEGIFISNWVNLIWDHVVAPMVALPITTATKGDVRQAYNISKAINPYLASQRAFDGYVNSIRVNSFKDMAKSLQNSGYNYEANPEVFEKAADFINTTTGRGSLGAADASSKWLNLVLFAPRKVISEVKLFTPYAFLYYAKMPKPVRMRALGNLATFLGTFLTTNALLWAASKPDDDDEEEMKTWKDFWNTNSSNFLTHKIGDKRVSIAGGAKSMIVFQSRFWNGKFVDQYGTETELGDRYGKQINTRFDLVTNFIAGKTAPVVNVGIQKAQERKGLELDNTEVVKNLTVPIWLQDLKDLYKKDPQSVNAIVTVLSIFGANVRTVDAGKTSPFTDEDKKDPTFKYFLDKGMNLPNVVPDSIEVPDKATKTIKNLTDFPEEKIKEYQDLHKKYLKEELEDVKKKGYVFVDDYGNVSQDREKGYDKTKIDDLTKEQLAKILKSAQVQATTKTKQKLFPK